MSIYSRTRQLCRGVAAAALISAAVAAPSYAQDVADADEAAAEDAIVVTGTRIARPELEAASPVTSISETLLRDSGQTGAGDIIQYVPALFSSVTSDLSATRANGILGGTFLNLRGLGEERTLVLVNGRRHVASDPGSAIIDVETIPNALIQRVDVLTGGASSIYGSDAVTGVVNYVLKKDFTGLELDAQAGISEKGDAGDYYLAGTFGRNFGGDRGNIVLSAQYNRSNPVSYGDRSYLRGNQRVDDDANPALRFQQGDLTPDLIAAGAFVGQTILSGGTPRYAVTPTGLIDRATSAPPRAFLPNRTFSISSALGLIGFDADGDFGVDDPGTDFDRNGVNDCDQTYNFNGTGFGCYVVDAASGRVRPFRDGQIAGFANAFGGDGIPVFLDKENIVPSVEQFNINLNLNYEFSSAFKPFIESKFVRTNASDVNNVNSFNDTIPIKLDNPFIPAELRTAIDAYYLANGGNPDDGQILISRDNTDFGPNRRKERRDTFRIVVGAEGDLGSGFAYEVSANYGQTKSRTVNENVRLEDRFYAAVDAVQLPNGNIVCRSSVNPNIIPGTSPFPSYDADPDGDGIFEPVTFATNDGSCRPLNLFGVGSPSAEAVAFVNPASTNRAKIDQLVIQGFLKGSTESFFSLPGGPVQFVVGGEYRTEKASFTPDPRDVAGLFYESGVQPSGGKYNVKEVFGEIEIPILADKPFFELLTLNASARYADYNLTNTNKAFTWGISGVYAPVKDFRIRGGFARAIRAPNITELFAPLSPATFRPIDVCDAGQINLGSNPAQREANCRADGIPVGFTDPLTARITGASGGNPSLQEETSDSYTIGAVFQPSFVPGFSLTADYWNYKITKAIASVEADDIVAGCYDSADFPNNSFCSLFTRNRTAGSSTFLGFNSFRNGPVNFERYQAQGVDVQALYRFDIGNAGKITARAGGSYTSKVVFFTSVTDPNSKDNTVGEAQRPKVAFNTGLAWAKDGLRVEWESFWQSKQYYQGVDDFDADIAFAQPNRTKSFWSHDLNFSYELNEQLKFRAGVNNLTNERPFVSEAAYPISPIGRSYFMGITAKY